MILDIYSWPTTESVCPDCKGEKSVPAQLILDGDFKLDEVSLSVYKARPDLPVDCPTCMKAGKVVREVGNKPCGLNGVPVAIPAPSLGEWLMMGRMKR